MNDDKVTCRTCLGTRKGLVIPTCPTCKGTGKALEPSGQWCKEHVGPCSCGKSSDPLPSVNYIMQLLNPAVMPTTEEVYEVEAAYGWALEQLANVQMALESTNAANARLMEANDRLEVDRNNWSRKAMDLEVRLTRMMADRDELKARLHWVSGELAVAIDIFQDIGACGGWSLGRDDDVAGLMSRHWPVSPDADEWQVHADALEQGGE